MSEREAPGQTIDLFVSCFVDLFKPSTAVAAVAVLERRGAEVGFPPGQTCCGQFAYNAGHWPEALAMAQNLLQALDARPAPDAIVGLSGSCVAMVLEEYPKLLAWAQGQLGAEAGEWAARHQRVAARLVELSQWLSREAPAEAKSGPLLEVAWHTGCHMRRVLRAEGDGPRVLADLGVAAADPADRDQCCGFGGTYAMAEPEISTALADEKLAALQAVGGSALAGCDWGCLLHLGGRLSRTDNPWPVLHLAELVDLADRGAATPAGVAGAGRFVPEVP